MIKNGLQVSNLAIRSYSLCVRKAYLLTFSPNLSQSNAYENMKNALSKITCQNYFNEISNKLIIEPFTTLGFSKGVDILTNVNLSVDFLSINNAVIIKTHDNARLDTASYEPIIFSSTNQIQPEDKIELSFIGYTLSKFLTYTPEHGYIVLADGKTVTVKLSDNIKKCLPSIDLLREWLTQESELPPICLNKHCPYCEFQNSCKETAIREDSLSLLGGITKKQILKFEKKVYSQ